MSAHAQPEGQGPEGQGPKGQGDVNRNGGFTLCVGVVYNKTNPMNKRPNVKFVTERTHVTDVRKKLATVVRHLLSDELSRELGRNQARHYRQDRNGNKGDVYPDDDEGAYMLICKDTLCLECCAPDGVVVVFINATTDPFGEADLAALGQIAHRVVKSTKAANKAASNARVKAKPNDANAKPSE